MSQNIGKVVEIIGPVVDIQFSQNNLPDLLTAIEIERPNEENLIVEVEQDIGADRVRCIAMGSTDGLVRGMDAIDTKKPIQAPAQNSPVKARSVPLSCVTRYCSAVSLSLIDSAAGFL